MNRIVAVAIFSTVVASAHAEGTALVRPDLVEGQAIRCEAFVKPAATLPDRNDTPIDCDVPDDVYATGSGAVVIPKMSRFFGWKKGARIEWTSWTTPDQLVVGDAVLHGTGFVSAIDPTTDSYTLVVLHDVVVPLNERH